MSEDVTLQQTADRGQRAERYLSDEVFVRAKERLEARLYDEWRNTDLEESGKRERIFLVQRALHELVIEITKEIDDGRVAQATILRRTRKG